MTITSSTRGPLSRTSTAGVAGYGQHWIPLEQMARSGTRGWTAAQRQAYANDPTVLIAVTAKSNRQKGSQDPARWLPIHRCEYVQAWVAIKTRYQVTVDQAEHDAIASVLRRCPKAR